MLDNIQESVKIEDCLKLKGPILILGASGFIGANLFKSILQHRNDCYGVVFTSLNSWRLEGIPAKNIKKCDLTDNASVKDLINNVNPKTIFNLSAYGAYSRQKDTIKIYNTNFIATCNILECLKEKDFTAYIHAGTSSEYGLNCDSPKENALLEPNSDYAVSKVACSYLINYYGKQLNLPVINLRLYSVYGPWEEPDRLIPKLVVNGIEKKYPPLVSPDISRDFVYIDDVSRSFISAGINADRYKGESFNIASGNKITIKELANYLKNHFNIPFEPVFANMDNRKWDLENWVGDADYAKKCLNWQAHTSIEEGLYKTEQWLKSGDAKQKNYIEFYKNFLPDQKENKDKISAVIACYKDAEAIPIMYERLAKTFNKINVDYEIIFVNDCSPDNSEKVIMEVSNKDPNVIGISHSRNFGSQSAFLSGMEISTGDAVVLLDGDLQDPPELIEQFYSKWKENYDVVYGVRTKREMSAFNEFFYKSFYQVFTMLSDVKMPKNAGDFSLIDRKVVNELLLLQEKDVFLRGLRAWVGFNQVGIPYIRPERAFGKSTNNLVKNIWWAKKGIFSFSHKPLEFISYLSMIVFFITFFLGIIQFLIRLYYPALVPPGLTTIILIILMLGGIQIFAISIIGEYIVKIIDETKKRPRYIRKCIITDNRKLDSAKNIEAFINKRSGYEQ
jgi:dolichol-phosphate mannosyltransferase